MPEHEEHQIQFDRVFNAAHRLSTDDVGKCGRIHGHNYRVQIGISSDALDEHGFVVDFATVKAYIDTFDHRLILYEKDSLLSYLVEFPDVQFARDENAWVVELPMQPTTENFARHIANGVANLVLEHNSNARGAVVTVILAETDSIAAQVVVAQRRSS